MTAFQRILLYTTVFLVVALYLIAGAGAFVAYGKYQEMQGTIAIIQKIMPSKPSAPLKWWFQ